MTIFFKMFHYETRLLGNIRAVMKFLLFSLLLSCFLSNAVVADVVKPALVEISVDEKGLVTTEIRASIEALLTGINSQYKNTKQAPNADEYDVYRQLPPEELKQAFESFKKQFLSLIYIKTGSQYVSLVVSSVDIPPAGYTKVPRMSVIRLTGQLSEQANSLQWYYPEKFGDNAVRVRQVDLTNEQWHWSQWQWLRKDAASEQFSLTEIVNKKSMIQVVASYISIGFEHIVPKGLDHILFILGLFLLSMHWRPLLWQVTMFTAAHTITLGMAMNGVISLPSNIVEPLIALSIAYVGIENILAKELHKSRLILVFLFGLLHGLGFAGVLMDFGMPDDDFITALISFNVGVELGQLAVLSTAFILLRLSFNNQKQYRQYIVVPVLCKHQHHSILGRKRFNA